MKMSVGLSVISEMLKTDIFECGATVTF